MTLKRGIAPKTVRRRRSSAASQETKVARLTRELSEALKQQTATTEVLKVISRSAFDLQTVLNTLVESVGRLCDAERTIIFRPHDDAYRLVASYGYSEEFRELLAAESFKSGRDSVSGRTAAEKTVVHVLDYQADPELRFQGPFEVPTRTILGVPLLREGALVGIMSLARSVVQPFNAKQIELATIFAAQAVIAIENTRLLSELRQRTANLTESLEQQTATSEVLQVISSFPGDLEPVFAAILEKATRICGAKLGTMNLREEDRFRIVAMHGVDPALKGKLQGSLLRLAPNTVLGRLSRSKEITHVNDVLTEPGFFETPAGFHGPYLALDAGARTLLGVPMLKESELIGGILIYRQEVRPFTDKQIALVTNFAAQAVIAIENTRLLHELRQRTTDLTERTTDLTEALEQQTATSKVLEVISRSAFDLHAVFEAVAESSVRLCGADQAGVFRFDGELLRLVAAFNMSQEIKEFIEHNPIRPSRSSGSGRAALERRTIHIPDVSADQEFTYGSKDFEAVRTILAVPIFKSDDLLGVVLIYHLEVRPFTDKQIALVETFADQAAIAIENTRLLDELRHRTDELGRSVEELRALGEVSQAVNSTLDLETVLSTIVAKAVQLSGTEAGAIYVFDDRQRELHLRATYGMDQELIDTLARQHIGLDEANVALALAQHEPVQIADLNEAAPSAVNDIILRAGFRALLVAPLLRGEEMIGMLVVRRRTSGTFPQNTVDLIKTFAAQSAVAIENARLFQNVEASLEDVRTAQDRLVQTEKLASLGQLTAGIAHEIKNPLNFVNNFSAVWSNSLTNCARRLAVRTSTASCAQRSARSPTRCKAISTRSCSTASAPTQSSRTCCCIPDKALESTGRSISMPWSMRASTSPITGRGPRSKVSLSPWRGLLTRPPVRSICFRRRLRGAAQLDLKRLLRSHETQSRGEWRRLRANACRHDQESRRQRRNQDTRQRHRHSPRGNGEAVQPVLYDQTCR